jgi:uncharacterized lipoprotein YmbA
MTSARLLTIVLILSVISACASAPVQDNYYSLVLANDLPAQAEDQAGNAHLIVGPVALPDFLNGRSLALQIGSNRIESANHHFWAEPLEEAISKVLVREVGRLNENITVDRDAGRWNAAADCRLRIEFDGFHATSDSRVVLSGRYWVSSDNGTARQEFALTKTLMVDGYAHAVDALRESLTTLSEQVSSTITSHSSCAG